MRVSSLMRPERRQGPPLAVAPGYWVSPTGAATWASAYSATPLSGAACCTIATANANAAAGDTIYLRGGDYTYKDASHRTIVPVNSGTSTQRITFQAAPGETPVLLGTWEYPYATYGVYLTRDYIVIDGLTIRNKLEGVHIVGGHYNEVRHCTMTADAPYPDAWGAAVIPVFLDTGASHNWLHHNTIHGFGAEDAEGTDGMRIGHSGDNSPHHNTFEDNLLYHFGHAAADDYGTHNVWRRNVMHNEGWKTTGFTTQVLYGTATSGASGTLVDTATNFVEAGVEVGDYVRTTSPATSTAAAVGVVSAITTTTNTNDTLTFTALSFWLPAFTAGSGYAVAPSALTNVPDPPGRLPGDGKYGHRNFSLSNDSGTDVAKYVLVEGNRFGYGSINYANRGAEGISLGSPGNIIRFNAVFGQDAAGIGIKFYTGAAHYGDNCRIYNNTLYKNGQATVSAPNDFAGTGVFDGYSLATVYKTHLLYQNGNAALDPVGDWSSGVSGEFANNLGDSTNAGKGTVAVGDPLFTDPDMTDPMGAATLPDLTLQAGSPALEAGGALTLANGAGSGSVTLVVDDALYFQDGTLGSALSDMHADWIAVGTVGNMAQISSINYATQTITLATPLTWADNAPVWLARTSDGTLVLNGAAPNAGAY